MAYINVDEVYILDNTGLQVDMATDIPFADAGFSDAQKEQARANIRAGGSNDNLLDNAYFVGGGSQLGDGVCPINQRGQASYSSAQVTIDRWTLFGGSVVLAADGITVTSSPDFGQVFEPSRLPVGTYTASVKTADGKIGSITFTTTGSQFFAGGAMGDTGVTLNFIDLWTPGKSLFSLQCQGVKIAAAKLELGTVSTLANDPPPDFGEELRKCQRYLWVYKVGANTPIGNGTTFGTSSAIDVVTPVPMRAGSITASFNVTPYIVYDGGLGICDAGAAIISHNGTGNHLRWQIGHSGTNIQGHSLVMLLAGNDTTFTFANEL